MGDAGRREPQLPQPTLDDGTHVGPLWATLWTPCGLPTWGTDKFGRGIHVGIVWAWH